LPGLKMADVIDESTQLEKIIGKSLVTAKRNAGRMTEQSPKRR